MAVYSASAGYTWIPGLNGIMNGLNRHYTTLHRVITRLGHCIFRDICRMKTIGLIIYKKRPLEALEQGRERALLAEAALQGTVFYLLDPSSHDQAHELILAYSWTQSSGWTPAMVRLPDVVIIVGSIRDEGQREVDRWIRSVRPVIADVGKNKVDQSDFFSSTAVNGYVIPWFEVPKVATEVFFSELLVQESSGIVVKRSDANQGIGLLFVVRLSENEYQVKHNDATVYGTRETAVDYLMKKIAGRLKYRNYIAQRYIRCLTPDGRPFDVRVHVQKRADGAWHVTRGYIRLAEAGSPLPNTSKGGYQGPLEGFLESRCVGSAAEIRHCLYQTALRIAEIQDTSVAVPLSELGVDLLLDEHDSIWLVETNALPQSYMHEQQRAQHTIGYALRMAESCRT